MRLKCPKTRKLENQETVKESEDGITLKCGGCGKIHSHEIGELAEFFDNGQEWKEAGCEEA